MRSVPAIELIRYTMTDNQFAYTNTGVSITTNARLKVNTASLIIPLTQLVENAIANERKPLLNEGS